MLWDCTSQPWTRDSSIKRISARSSWRRVDRHDNICPFGERLDSTIYLPIYYLVRNIVPVRILALINGSLDSLIYFDDLTNTDVSSVREFHARFVSSRPQMHPLLDYYAKLLREALARNYFLPSSANLVVSSSLDFVTGLIVDYDLQKMPVRIRVWSGFRWTNVPSVIRVGFEPWWASR